jgi:hypothetical protein
MVVSSNESELPEVEISVTDNEFMQIVSWSIDFD